MTVLDILAQWLSTNGYDGLYSEDCGCHTSDLAPCGGEWPMLHCKPGYAHPATAEECEEFEIPPGTLVVGAEKSEVQGA